MKRLAPPDFTAMPWRNGGGITHEIAKREDDKGLLWRISTARVEADGPYSKFRGLTRLSTVVEGVGIRFYNEDTGEKTVLKPPVIARIPGDSTIRGDLLDGGIRHLNLVYDANRVRAQMLHLKRKRLTIRSGDAHAIYCVAGNVVTEGAEIGTGEVLLTETGTLSVRGEAVWIALAMLNAKQRPPRSAAVKVDA